MLTKEAKPIIHTLADFVRAEGKTFTEIFDWLQKNNYKQYLHKLTLSNDQSAHCIQFINWGYAVKDNRLLFTDIIAFTPELNVIDLTSVQE